MKAFRRAYSARQKAQKANKRAPHRAVFSTLFTSRGGRNKQVPYGSCLSLALLVLGLLFRLTDQLSVPQE